MAKTRLTVGDRDAIRAALLAHKYTPIFNAYLDQENALALGVWESFHGPHKALIDQLPEGALASDTDVYVNANGLSLTLRYGGGYTRWTADDDGPEREEVRKVEFASYKDRQDLKGDLADAVSALSMARKATVDERTALDSKLYSTLAKFTTFDALLEAWPEAEVFINDRMVKRGLSLPSNVPAVLIFDLTKELDLPPEDVAEAA